MQNGSEKGLNFFEVVGVVVICGVAVAIVFAPLFTHSALGGALVGGGARLLRTGLLGRDGPTPLAGC